MGYVFPHLAVSSTHIQFIIDYNSTSSVSPDWHVIIFLPREGGLGWVEHCRGTPL